MQQEPGGSMAPEGLEHRRGYQSTTHWMSFKILLSFVTSLFAVHWASELRKVSSLKECPVMQSDRQRACEKCIFNS